MLAATFPRPLSLAFSQPGRVTSLILLGFALMTIPGGSRIAIAQATDPEATPESRPLEVLFIGNSYTARHNLAKLVKQMAEVGNPGLTLNVSSVIYGGRTLADHWRLGTQNIVNLHSLTPAQETATIASLEATIQKNPKDSHAKSALTRHRKLREELDSPHPAWDVIVLQSYRDDAEGAESRYARYAPKFAALAKSQGARVILYETTPTTQNAVPLEGPPDSELVLKKAGEIASLADSIGADVAPMSLVGMLCQTQRPDLTLRFVNDAHLNQTMAYLTACTLYAALFDRSPEGLPVDSVTDIRFFKNDPAQRERDRDGDPITRKFSDADRSQLQRIAWEGYTRFKTMRNK